MSWIKQIKNIKKQGGSGQFEEAEIIAHIFENIGTTNKFLVDLGCGAYGNATMSNTRDMMNSGWQGFGVDMNPMSDEWVVQQFIQPQTIVPILKGKETPKEFDFLNLDIDSCDFWVLKNILEAGYSPRLICAEYNGTLDPNKSLVLEYEEGYTWDETNKYGFSLGAGKKLLKKYGYTIIYCQHDTNLFAIKSDLVNEPIELNAKQNPYHPNNPNAIWVNY
jgi:hypothetical protein